jgi:ribonucleoside-diphosphate reductase alpha chain
MLPDTIGRGVGEGTQVQPAEAIATIKRVTSTGYVRNRLVVVQGGGTSHGANGANGSGNGSAGRLEHGSVVVAKAQAVGGGNGLHAELVRQEAVAVSTQVIEEIDLRLDRIREAKLKGYEGDACGECGNFTLVRNGTCLKCTTCGSTSGCS